MWHMYMYKVKYYIYSALMLIKSLLINTLVLNKLVIIMIKRVYKFLKFIIM